MSRLKAAVVGVGYLGRFHAEKYRTLDQVELVGVCDLDESRGRDVARACATEFIPDYRELAGRVDAVTIAADTSAHFDLSKFFLEHDVHVLVEKPMTRTSAEGAVLTRLAAQRGLKLQVGHVERFNPALLAARGNLDTVRFIECHRLAPFKPRGTDVHVVLDLMIHDLDVLLSLVNAKPTRVSAVGIAVLTERVDIANARIEFDSGAIANVTASRVSTSAQRKFRVFQHSQYVSIDFGNGEVRRISSQGALNDGMPALTTENWSLEKGDALLEETKSFVSAILEDEPCEVTGEDGVLALELAENIMDEIARRVI